MMEAFKAKAEKRPGNFEEMLPIRRRALSGD
jgi:hypothetical protein